ncbi:carbohydrate ABC transporter permease [Sphaerochaeta sp.]|jgi:multiple sugar transport system permease protein|uniref:carbohydrate ABC transporter permease n=1 Tax=Sphaerochaeta sp. TaxID=1972642 RepID=UPI000AA71A3C|nr:carbohydrate ABC transporter permease [Sphaerochaeta sp.]MDD2394396.1 carbohydrate ABC transporter permease [Sphaerochaeta sp.]MDD3456122.1 carbohydrate ABC transporter permease [Sphaerochaeta sp.]MDT3358389.1 carbohydrate ABC transporter permease [Spirochaetota bacterium]
MRKRSLVYTLLLHAVLIVVSLTMIVPFVWMILTAFKTAGEAIQLDPYVFFPTRFQFNSFIRVFTTNNFLNLYKNTLLLIAFRILCAVITASMAGFAFARLKFFGSELAFSLVLVQMMIPSQIFIIPQYLMISKLGMTNTTFALVFPGLVTAFGTFLMRQAYKILPKDLEDAAKIDGLNIGKTFVLVLAPLTKSSLVALSVFTAVFAYKELMWPMIVNTSKDSLVLASALAKMKGQYVANYPELMAASLIACVPMIVLYFIFQKQFIEGIATSGGKL